MDQWRSHIPRNNLPKQFCERCFELGDQKSQKNELELVLELVGDFFWEEEEVCGCRNKWRGATMGPRGRGAHPGPSWAGACSPAVFSVPDILKYSIKKSYFNFGAFGELLFSGYFYIAWINQKTDRKILFLLYFN